MTRILPLPPAAPTALARASRPAGSAAFVMPEAGVAGVAPPLALAGLQPGLLDLQSEPDGNESGRRRARALLAGLAALQLRLLAAEDEPPESLLTILLGLRAQLRDLPRPEDPGLAAALAGLALRAEVEVARRLPH